MIKTQSTKLTLVLLVLSFILYTTTGYLMVAPALGLAAALRPSTHASKGILHTTFHLAPRCGPCRARSARRYRPDSNESPSADARFAREYWYTTYIKSRDVRKVSFWQLISRLGQLNLAQPGPVQILKL